MSEIRQKLLRDRIQSAQQILDCFKGAPANFLRAYREDKQDSQASLFDSAPGQADVQEELPFDLCLAILSQMGAECVDEEEALAEELKLKRKLLSQQPLF